MRKRLQRRGFGHALGLQTWQTHTIVKGDTKLTVTSLPGRHAPGWTQLLLPPVMGTMLEFGPADGSVQRRLYISGDTLLVEELKEIPLRFKAIDAGVLDLGGTRLLAGWLPFGLTVTMDARQGVGVFEMVKLPKMIPVHFDDYDPAGEFHKKARCVHRREHYFDEPRLSGVRGTLKGVPQLADGTDRRGAYIRAAQGGGQLCPVPRDE
jgi:L-ascorbate metabolism protein UlaG (beta-lactamase superfamily)